MFEELIARVRRKQAEFEFELVRVSDPYRLSHLLKKYTEDFDDFFSETLQMVKELEGIDNE